MSRLLNRILRLGLLLSYAAALLSLLLPLPLNAGPLAQRFSLIVLGLHVLETALVWKLLPRHPGTRAASVALSLLYGLLHWAPLARAQGDSPSKAAIETPP